MIRAFGAHCQKPKFSLYAGANAARPHVSVQLGLSVQSEREWSASMKIDGGCHCGAIRYEASVSPQLVTICHCADCQTISGSPYRVTVRALRETFRLSGEPQRYVKVGSSGDEVVTTFCGTCGSALYSFKEENDFVNLRLGGISQRAQLAPTRQGFCRSALPWAFDISEVTKVS
jgi:hypothetical protein